MKKEDAFQIGQLSKTKGLKGELKFVLYAEPEELPDELNLCYVQNGSALIPYTVKALQLSSKNGVIWFDDLNSIEEAQKLVGKNLYIDAADKQKVAFSFKDLVSFEVKDEIQGKIGSISAIEKYPQQWIARIPSGKTEILIPLNDEIVVRIISEQKIVLVRLPEGLLEIYRQ